MDEITKIVAQGKEIWVIDYSNCNEEKMIVLLTHIRKQIREENKVQRVLAIFNEKSFLTPKVMQVYNAERLGSHLIERQAAIGVNPPKEWIIKGNNILQNNNIQIFNSKEEALRYLAE